MFKAAGVDDKKSNHSLRAAGVSQLFEAGVIEKIIQSRSGHRSLEALRLYERVISAQEKAVSTILASETQRKFHKELESTCSSSSVVEEASGR